MSGIKVGSTVDLITLRMIRYVFVPNTVSCCSCLNTIRTADGGVQSRTLTRSTRPLHCPMVCASVACALEWRATYPVRLQSFAKVQRIAQLRKW